MSNSEEEVERQIKVAIYLRVSTDDQAEKGYGLDAQEASVKAFIESRGKLSDGITPRMVLANFSNGSPRIYADDISGTVDYGDRPQFAALIRDYENAPENNKPFETVCIYKIDRLARSLKILLDIVTYFKKSKIDLVSVNESIDTTTPFGMAILGIMGVIAQLELETIKMRTRAGREAKARSGKVSVAPYGYTKDQNEYLILLKEEAEVVKRIFEMCIYEHLSIQRIATILTSEKNLNPTPSAIKHGKKKSDKRATKVSCFWTPITIRHILRDEVYIGRLYFNKTKDGKSTPKSQWARAERNHQAIISETDFRLVGEILDRVRSSVKEQKEQEPSYLLRGLLRCAHCTNQTTRKMVVFKGKPDKLKSGGVSRTYVCSNNSSSRRHIDDRWGVIPIPADQIEDFVKEFVNHLLANPKALFNAQKHLKHYKLTRESLLNEQKKIDRAMRNIEKERERINKLFIRGEIGESERDKLKVEVTNEYTTLLDQYNKINGEINGNQFDNDAVTAFEAFSIQYQQEFARAKTEPAMLYKKIINSLIREIIVTSRPACDLDIIAGRKRPNQMIPDQIEIVMRLPQDIMKSLNKEKYNKQKLDGDESSRKDVRQVLPPDDNVVPAEGFEPT